MNNDGSSTGITVENVTLLTTSTNITGDLYAFQVYVVESFEISEEQYYKYFTLKSNELTIDSEYFSTVKKYYVQDDLVNFFNKENAYAYVLSNSEYLVYTHYLSNGFNLISSLSNVISSSSKEFSLADDTTTITLNTNEASYVLICFKINGEIYAVCEQMIIVDYTNSGYTNSGYTGMLYESSNRLLFTTSTSIDITTDSTNVVVTINSNTISNNFEFNGTTYTSSNIYYIMLTSTQFNELLASSSTRMTALKLLIESDGIDYVSNSNLSIEADKGSVYIMALFADENGQIIGVSTNALYVNTETLTYTIVYSQNIIMDEVLTEDNITKIYDNSTTNNPTGYDIEFDSLTGTANENITYIAVTGSNFKTIASIYNYGLSTLVNSLNTYSDYLIVAEEGEYKAFAFKNLSFSTYYYILAVIYDDDGNISASSINAVSVYKSFTESNSDNEMEIYDIESDIIILDNEISFVPSAINIEEMSDENGGIYISASINESAVTNNYVNYAINTIYSSLTYLVLSAEEYEIFKSYYNDGLDVTRTDGQGSIHYDNMSIENALELTINYYRYYDSNTLLSANLASGNYTTVEQAIGNLILTAIASVTSSIELTAEEGEIYIFAIITDSSNRFLTISSNYVKISIDGSYCSYTILGLNTLVNS